MLRFFAHKIVSKLIANLLLIVLVLNVFVFPSRAFALTAGPSQPEFSSFNSVSSSEMVNMFTGDFSYNIPLMDVDGYPINISYNASPGMDQEASWTGLGWNINSGAINRNMRGLPDDFNSEEIMREINIKDFKAWGVGIGAGIEIVGKGVGASSSVGLGVTKSNYKGYGLEFYFEPTFAVSAGSKLQGSLTAGLGVKASTTDGVDIYPQVGVGGQLQSGKTTSSLGYNIGASINSRDGLKSINNGINFSVGRIKKEGEDNGKGSNNGGVGMGAGSSSSIPASSQGFMPQLMSDMVSQSYSYDFKLGLNACFTAPFGYIKGYYAQNGLASRDVKLNGYGYLHSGAGDRQALHDFSREKDGMMYPETPNLPITNYSYDMFSASAQGMEMAFRPQRNDIGMVHDNPTDETSFGVGVGGEVLLLPDVNFGVNVNTFWSNGHYGRWDDFDNMLDLGGFTNSDAAYESAYFKVAGEKTPDDAAFLNTIQNEKAVRTQIHKVSDTKWGTTGNLETGYGAVTTLPGASPLKKASRAIRNTLVSYLNAGIGSLSAIEPNVTSFKQLTTSSFNSSNFDNVIASTNAANAGELLSTAILSTDNRINMAGGKQDHLSEITVTNPSGSRYVYGIPVYNTIQREVVFNASGSGFNNASASRGLVNFSGTDASKSNSKGLDNYFEKNHIPPYAHSYLLTSLLSSDFVDRTGNGPSADDYGDYTKFNYSNVGEYNWRMPYELNKASFNQGFNSDAMDDKGSYVYGQKNQWYPHSIETKNYIAFFVLNDNNSDPRLDAIGSAGEQGGKGLSKARFLKQIRLYAKKDFTGGIANSQPIKIVNFEYDYSLCPGVPNHAATNASSPGVPIINTTTNLPTNGKLTLKKVWFTYGNSNKGVLNPYVFNYCNGNYTSSAYNPAYDPSSSNRWGTYQQNTLGNANNLDFPYVKQDKAQEDINAMAWCLTEVKTPAGSKINVTYEADDYAYVQNKEAGQMFKLIGLGSSLSSVPNGNIYGNNVYMFVDLSTSKDKGVPVTAANPTFLMKQKYIKDLQEVYIKANVNLRGGRYEQVPLYGEIEDVYTSSTSIYSYGGNSYYNAIIKLKTVGINDDGLGNQINPIVKAAFQLGRMYLPGVMFPGSSTSGTNESIIKGMVTLIQDARFMFSGINKALYNRNIANTIDPATSIARLYNPGGNKLGGGSRVKKIEINDNWNAMTGEQSSTYGQEYSYTTLINGQEVSSGVASYEPLSGGDENSLRKALKFSIKRVMAPNDLYFQEEPLGESFYPDAMVGYSKVTVKNLDRTSINVKKHATGKTEFEFYTAKDFPVSAERTPLSKQRVKPQLIRSLLKFGSTDKLFMSQGFVIRTNDMHGKPKGQKSYAEDAISAYSGITYYYKTKPNLNNQLDNTVSVITDKNVISNKLIGQTTDIIHDSRFAETDMWGAGVAVNINSAACTVYTPLVFVWPSFSHENREFSSISTTKVINQYGLIDYAEAFENNSVVKTHNLLYDEQTGDIVLTKTTNNFNDPVYSLSYPAYWAYNRMGHAYKNIGINIVASGLYTPSSGLITGSYFIPGDEVLVLELPPSNIPIYTKTWVSKDVAGGGANYLVKADGQIFFANTTTLPNKIFLTITRSGNRNMQQLPMASLSSLQNPIVGNKIDANTSTKVLTASAVEYSENWQTLLGNVFNVASSCSCIDTPFKTAEFNFLNYFLSTNPYKAAIQSGTSTSLNQFNLWVNGTGYLNTTVQTFLQQISGVSNYISSSAALTTPIKVEVSKSIDYSVPNFRTDNLEFKILPITICSTANPSTAPAPPVYHVKLSKTLPFTGLNAYLGANVWNFINQLATESINSPCFSCGGSSARFSNNSSILSVGNAFCGDVTPSANYPVATFDYAATDLTNNVSGGYYGATINGSPTNLCYVRTNCTITQSSSNQCGKLVGNTVNPYVENLRGNWRPKYDYSYLTSRVTANNIKTDGNFTTYKPFYDHQGVGTSPWEVIYTRSFNNTPGVPYDNWIRNSELQLMNQYGNPLQTSDALNRRSATLYGYNHTLPVASASNAYYNEIAFDSFEDYDYVIGDCSGMLGNSLSGYVEHFNFYTNKSNIVNATAHTGRNSLLVGGNNSSITVSRKLNDINPSGALDNIAYTLKAKDNAGLFGPFYNKGSVQNYILSVWARENTNAFAILPPQVSSYTSPNVSISIGGANLVTTVKRSPIINGWQKLEYEFSVSTSNSSNSDIKITLNSNTPNVFCFFDDIRIHPFNSNMKSMVYDPKSLRLMAELDDRNYATIYEYDEEGTLVRVKKETEKGIYTIKETRSGLKK
jgi:hypothetical protein